MRQDKTIQYTIIQDKTRQDKTLNDNTIQYTTIGDNTRQDNTV